MKHIYSNSNTLLYTLHCNLCCLGVSIRKQVSNENISGSLLKCCFIFVFYNIHLIVHQHRDICHTLIEFFLVPVLAFRVCFINHLSIFFLNCFHLAKNVSSVNENILLYWWKQMIIARRPTSHISRKMLVGSHFKYTSL